MAKDKDYEKAFCFDINEALKEQRPTIYMRVRVSGLLRFRVRMWFATKIIKVGCWVAGFNNVVTRTDEE